MHGPRNSESQKGQYRYQDGNFFSGQINMAVALNDIGPGDGAPMPGLPLPATALRLSHPPHPSFLWQVQRC